ncbi:hypothetical protein GCM10009847_13000 [Leucobacter tardus]
MTYVCISARRESLPLCDCGTQYDTRDEAEPRSELGVFSMGLRDADAPIERP